jgi:hypothetical protein
MRDVRRKIVKPPEPALGAPEANRHDSNNGSRLHYPAWIDSILVGNERRELGKELQIHYKQCKAVQNEGTEASKKDKKKILITPEFLAKSEVVFSELSYALLGKTMTAKPYLAVDDADHSKIVGLATDQFDDLVTIDRCDSTVWSEMDRRRLGRVSMMLLITAEDDAHKHNMGSKIIDLPNMIQDPADPNNMIKDRETPPQVIRTPVNIDHDMNWYDQLFSRFRTGNRYLLHPFGHNRHDFDSEDIDNFPMTKKFQPHHWMTRPNRDIDRKGYNAADKKAMQEMKGDLEFQKGAYFQLLSFILLPKDLLRAMLLQHIEETDILFPLILNTWIEQQANLKAAALGSKEFRNKICDNAALVENREEFKQLITAYSKDINKGSANSIRVIAPNDPNHQHPNNNNPPHPHNMVTINPTQLIDSFTNIITTYNNQLDTELHAAILSESFRFDESMQRFGQHLSKKNNNENGETPIVLTVRLGLAAAKQGQWGKVEYFKRIARFLADQKKGPALPADYSDLLEKHEPVADFDHLPASYEKLKLKLSHNLSIEDDIKTLNPQQYKKILAEALRDRQHNKVSVELIKGFSKLPQHEAVQTLENCLLEALNNTLKALKNDTSMTLKMKKNAAILAFEAVTPQMKSANDFNELREILIAPENKFIQQLTSRFEIVRHLRGLYGVTSTYKTIAHSINTHMQKIDKKDANTKARISVVQQEFSNELHTFFGRHTCRTQVETFEHRAAREHPAIIR